MNDFNDLMIDLETLGTKRGCQVLSIGSVFFGPSGLGPRLYQILDLNDQADLGLVTDPDTVAWWGRQSAEARRVFTDPKTPLQIALTEFSQFCAMQTSSAKLRVWGNGSDFDNPILEDVFTAADCKVPWRFYNNRCYRTLKGFAPKLKLDRAGTHHNALDDAVTQAEHAVKLLDELGLWSRIVG
jgi:hypothetical protein